MKVSILMKGFKQKTNGVFSHFFLSWKNIVLHVYTMSCSNFIKTFLNSKCSDLIPGFYRYFIIYFKTSPDIFRPIS